ncbi:Na+/H+ antiporter subunit E [Halomonas mongoliensis]|uniref:Na+/H+ antiporter subunit E n=1 Tax=Halomonas mongoliensis TaxID=321265 RepID=A0ABU1GKZ8_9GAMM|nr:Na+/H+ antiporter subunit E [Halomonas mongoliensis]MDR5892695.1 Na+/H+ antiporter subunit E [Halomonas mongoliensis]
MTPGRLARRLLLLALLWWALSGGGSAWAWGVPVILVAALVMPRSGVARLRPLALLAFLPMALWLALRGGLQVAMLACRPGPSPHSRVIDHPWHCLPEGPGRLLMASLVNLIPGTLTLRLTPAGLQVHVLQMRADTRLGLARLETRVAHLYAVSAAGNASDEAGEAR